MRWLEAERGLSFTGYHDLWEWSVTDLEGFWGSLWDYFDVQASRPYERVLGRRDLDSAEWFPGAELSYAEHIFRGKPDDRVAIVHASELRPQAELTWGELRAETARVAAGLRELGVERGDRVAAYLPNIPEAAIAFLACASIGAIWSSCSPDFGARSVVDRLAQIEPKVLFAVDGYRYGGRDFDRLDVVAEIQGAIGSLERTVVLPYLDPAPDLGRLADAVELGRPRALERGRRARVRAAAVRPPALGALLVRHDRAAEGDRPRAGRDPARVPEAAAPDHRRPGRRPDLLVLDDRLDDVELPDRSAADRRGDRDLRRQSRRARSRRAVGSRRVGAASPASARAPPTSPRASRTASSRRAGAT